MNPNQEFIYYSTLARDCPWFLVGSFSLSFIVVIVGMIVPLGGQI